MRVPATRWYDATGIVFQTKDLGCSGERWTITRDGKLLNPDGSEDGTTVNIAILYTNLSAKYRGYCTTVDNAAPRWWCYAFAIHQGQVIAVVGGAEDLPGTLVSPSEFLKRVWGR